jgi:hypothetical protein
LKESDALGARAEENGYLLFYVHDSVQNPRSQKTSTRRTEPAPTEAQPANRTAAALKSPKRKEAAEPWDVPATHIVIDSEEEKKEKKKDRVTTPYSFDNIVDDSDDVLALSFFEDITNTTSTNSTSTSTKSPTPTPADANVNRSATAADATRTIGAKPEREDGRTNGKEDRPPRRDPASRAEGGVLDVMEDEDEELKRAIELSLAEAAAVQRSAAPSMEEGPTRTEKREPDAGKRPPSDHLEDRADEEDDEDECALIDKRKRRRAPLA